MKIYTYNTNSEATIGRGSDPLRPGHLFTLEAGR